MQGENLQSIAVAQRFETFATEKINRVLVVRVAVMHESGVGETRQQLEEGATVKASRLFGLPLRQIGFEALARLAALQQIFGNGQGIRIVAFKI